MSPKRLQTTSRSQSRNPSSRKRNGFRSRSRERNEKRRSASRDRKRERKKSSSRIAPDRRDSGREIRRERSTSRRDLNSEKSNLKREIKGERIDSKRNINREKSFSKRENSGSRREFKGERSISSKREVKRERSMSRREIKRERSRSRDLKGNNYLRDEPIRKMAGGGDDRSRQRNGSGGRVSRIRRSGSRDYESQKKTVKRRSISPKVTKSNSIQEKLMRLAQKSPDINLKQSNPPARRDMRRSRSQSNNNIKNANKVPLVNRGRPDTRDSSQPRGTVMRGEKSRGSRKRSRSNSRTMSIQEKLLMLSQNQAQPATKENFSTRNRSPSKDPNKNANKVPLARKDRNQGTRNNRSISRSNKKPRSIRSRTRSRSKNRITRPQDFQSRSPARRGRSPLVKKKETKDLSKINNRLLNLAHDQYGGAENSSRDQSEDDKLESKEKHKKDKKKKKEKKKKKSSSSESDDSGDSSSHKKKKKKKGKKKKGKRAVDELNASIAEIEEKTKSVSGRDEKEDRDRRVPMTKEMWEKQQSVVRREFDSDTGRVRLVKGGGEILEECVSKDRQREINRQATVGDGQAFQRDIKSRLGVKARLY